MISTHDFSDRPIRRRIVSSTDQSSPSRFSAREKTVLESGSLSTSTPSQSKMTSTLLTSSPFEARCRPYDRLTGERQCACPLRLTGQSVTAGDQNGLSPATVTRLPLRVCGQ